MKAENGTPSPFPEPTSFDSKASYLENEANDWAEDLVALSRVSAAISGLRDLEAILRIGLDNVLLDEDEQTVAFEKEGMRLDFGGIGKGLALDVAAKICRQFGVKSALLNAGSSTIVAIGAPPGKMYWTVGIRNPYNSSVYLDEAHLSDEALSTSAGYERWFELDGKKYCHIFDPRNGKPVEGLVSATVITTSGIKADALSTAFFVLGETGAKTYCNERPDVRAIIVPHTGDEPKARRIGF